jgi:hypothetical protein
MIFNEEEIVIVMLYTLVAPIAFMSKILRTWLPISFILSIDVFTVITPVF